MVADFVVPPEYGARMDANTSTIARQPPRVPMVLTRWRGGKAHVTRDGAKTACGALIPTTALMTAPRLDWYLHGTCYNCTHRLWPEQGPVDYICPADGSDFPPERRCPHGTRAKGCVRCTPSAAQNWPCRNGCTDPADHDPVRRYTACTVFPPQRTSDSGGRCVPGCESTEKAMHRANPKLRFDLADSASTTCYHCRESVCVACQTAPVDGALMICDRCAAC
ncbi:hypothetical protein GCM10009827_078650 [Dactylosporangium maewongense]|uniref:Uncharacterized protein n=1 Tax=Dactylosporangium maewongense TaxID=634393 RepID=A0ABP4MM10_9ACTN